MSAEESVYLFLNPYCGAKKVMHVCSALARYVRVAYTDRYSTCAAKPSAMYKEEPITDLGIESPLFLLHGLVICLFLRTVALINVLFLT